MQRNHPQKSDIQFIQHTLVETKSIIYDVRLSRMTYSEHGVI